MSIQSDADALPMLWAFGTDAIKRLPDTVAADASPQERLRSVWPMVSRASRKFVASLSPRERATFDEEDVASEIAGELLRKDNKWTLERGSYPSFVVAVIKTTLSRIRDRTRPVRLPGNSAAKARKLLEADQSGAPPSLHSKTDIDLLRAVASCASISGTGGFTSDAGEGQGIADEDPGPEEIAGDREESARASQLIFQAIRQLSPAEALLIGKVYGLWGQVPTTPREMACSRNTTTARIKREIAAAEAALRERIEAIEASR